MPTEFSVHVDHYVEDLEGKWQFDSLFKQKIQFRNQLSISIKLADALSSFRTIANKSTDSKKTNRLLVIRAKRINEIIKLM
ncbi:hypothetical protein Glove_130g194 [Diversispora epigaea]|uniref:Uncharacterized protein n=1 Tax=Diversispora epigaea TaxID=1348612 RepID=A0A397J256_9GLOM|nr:hypothetical protein Glove_130g194 [Diversispora epigaea]